ncbi:hypothetical protein, partial [Salmonella sp. s51944]|uniref:hypothetical protein n=1 Tax=Salmonella sp. s51944 TaxID=3159655 RepID=UPI00397FD1B8
ACFLIFIPVFTTGEACVKPTINQETYTTTEAVTSTDTVFLVEFQLVCANSSRIPSCMLM